MAKEMKYILGISDVGGSGAGGHGRAFKEIVRCINELVVLMPSAKNMHDELFKSKHIFKFTALNRKKNKSRYIIKKIYNILSHIEMSILPLIWIILATRNRPSLIVASGPLFCGGLGALLLKKITNIPFITLVHGEELSRMARKVTMKDKIYFYFIRFVLRNARGVICNSYNTWRLTYMNYGIDPSKLTVIYPSIDVSEFIIDKQKAILFKKQLVGASQLIFMAGRIEQTRKGFDKAIEALPNIMRKYPTVKLVIAGPGDQKRLKELCKKYRVNSNVLFLGEIERSKLIMLFAVCDVFLFPARNMPDGDIEGFGITILEANVMGRPVIVGRSGGTEEAVIDGETGLLIDGNNVQQIASAIICLLSDKTYANKLGAEGQVRVLRDFNTRIQGLKCAELIKQFAQKLAISENMTEGREQ